MKGITHFLTGVATASCFPLAIQTALDEKSYLMVLGGVCGIMCDTLDFKFARYFWKHDVRVQLTEDNLDPSLPAKAIAEAIDRAATTGKPVHVKLDIIRLSTNYYRTYAVQIDDRRKEVTCTIGPLKTMSHSMARGENLPGESARRHAIDTKGPASIMETLAREAPCLPGTLPEGNLSAVASFKADAMNTYYMDTEVGIFSGPDYELSPDKDGKVRIDFIPWHRRWTHSVTLGLLMGPIGFALFAHWGALASGHWAAFINPFAVNAFFIAILAFWSHVLVDQMGHLGSNLYPPFTKKRVRGWDWSTSSSPFSNLMTNYISASIILWNINAYSPVPVFTMSWAGGIAGGFGNSLYYIVSALNYAAAAVALPLLIMYLVVRIYRRMYYSSRQIQLEEGYSGADWSGDIGDL